MNWTFPGRASRRARVEQKDYIRPTWLTGSPVCASTVTGSLLFGSSHIRVRGRFHSTLLCLLRFDGLDVVRWSTDIQYGFRALLLVTIHSRLTPDIIASVLIVSGSGPSFCGACVIAHWETLNMTGRSFAGVDSIWFLLGISRGLCLSWFASPTVWWREVSWRQADHPKWIRRVLLLLLWPHYQERF